MAARTSQDHERAPPQQVRHLGQFPLAAEEGRRPSRLGQDRLPDRCASSELQEALAGAAGQPQLIGQPDGVPRMNLLASSRLDIAFVIALAGGSILSVTPGGAWVAVAGEREAE